MNLALLETNIEKLLILDVREFGKVFELRGFHWLSTGTYHWGIL